MSWAKKASASGWFGADAPRPTVGPMGSVASHRTKHCCGQACSYGGLHHRRSREMTSLLCLVVTLTSSPRDVIAAARPRAIEKPMATTRMP